MVTFSYRENFHFLTTQNTDLLGFLGAWWIHVVEKAQIKFYVICCELDPQRPKRLRNESLNCSFALKHKLIGIAGRCLNFRGCPLCHTRFCARGPACVQLYIWDGYYFFVGDTLLWSLEELLTWLTWRFEAPRERLQSAKTKRRKQNKQHINFNVILLLLHITLILQLIIIKAKEWCIILYCKTLHSLLIPLVGLIIKLTDWYSGRFHGEFWCSRRKFALSSVDLRVSIVSVMFWDIETQVLLLRV